MGVFSCCKLQRSTVSVQASFGGIEYRDILERRFVYTGTFAGRIFIFVRFCHGAWVGEYPAEPDFRIRGIKKAAYYIQMDNLFGVSVQYPWRIVDSGIGIRLSGIHIFSILRLEGIAR